MELEAPPSVLSTPIKKIRNLTLNSPSSPLLNFAKTSPRSQNAVRYPSMSDLPASDPIFSSMVEKGYSQAISNKVLVELDNRANEITTRIASKPLPTKKKRYSGVHRPLFAKMESILAHYAATRAQKEPLPQKEYSGSATKKRRTLNGPEEIFGDLAADDESPVRRRDADLTTNMDIDSSDPSLLRQGLLTTEKPHLEPVSQIPAPLVPFGRLSPFLTRSSLSPSRNNRISPSKGSMNLNGLLNDDSAFVKPAVPKSRQSSLQMAGVSPGYYRNTSFSPLPSGQSNSDLHKMLHGSLHKKSSIPSLQKKTSIPSLQKKPSIPTLQKKPSIPSLQKKTSIPTLQKKPSVPSLLKKSSVASPKKLTSVASLQKPPLMAKNISSQSLRTVSSPKPLCESASRTKDMLIPPSPLGGLRSHFASHTLQKQPSSTSLRSNVTIPKPFSLYDKPTVSSSQKSLNSLVSNRTLEDARSASQRSLNRFQRFKNRFS